MWNQQTKQASKKKSEKVFGWLRAVSSLIVVMGLTWIIGLLVVEVEELAALAYIYTISVSFQGVFLFAVLVVIPKAVRDDVNKCLRNNLKDIKKYFGFNQDSSHAVSKYMC